MDKGATFYLAKNPEFGAVFTYFINEVPKSDKQKRKDTEKKLFKDGKPIKQLSWKEARDEKMLEKTYLLFTITDEQGEVVRKLTKKPSAGVSRINWDLRHTTPYPIRLKENKFDPFKKSDASLLVMPGKYKVSMTLVDNGKYTELAPAQDFMVMSLNNTTLPAPDRKALVDFQEKGFRNNPFSSGRYELCE